MPVPSPRSKLLPARGNYSDLAANVAELLDGEICYAIDQDQYYQKEGSVLVSVGATKAQGLLADSALQDAPSDGSEYVRKDGAWAVATGGGGGVAGVSSIIAGSGISIDQATGDVTITATGGGGGSGATQLNELTDVDLSTPATDGQVLAYDNSSSTFKPVAPATGGAAALDELSDVDLTSAPSNGQVLVYDSAESVFKPSTIVADGAGQPVIQYVINAAGTSAYTFAGPGFTTPTGNPELYVVRGQTYVFGNESGAHPFQIQSTAGQGGTAYGDGVTGNNTIGDVILTVPYDAPDTLYYQCTAHSSMGGTINVATVSAGGGGTDISTASIGDLADVDTTGVAPQDGDNLAWSEADSAWIPLSSGGGTNYGPFTPQNYHTFDSTDTASDASADLQDWDGPVTTDEVKVGGGACDGRPTNSACEAQGQFGDVGILTGNAFSINFWYYHDGVTEGTANNVIGCTKAGVTNPSGLLIRVLSSTFNLPTEMTDRGVQYQSLVLMNDNNQGGIVGTKFPVLDGVWRHYSFTHDGNGLYKLWVDGVLHDSKDNGSAVDFSDAGAFGTFDGEFTLMGSRNDGGGRNYGILDNFAIYDEDVFAGVDGVVPLTSLLQPSNQPFGFTISPPIGASTELSDFSPTPAAEGQIPVFTSGEYVPGVLGINDLSDVDTATAAPTKGQLLSYNDVTLKWEPSDRGAGTVDPVSSPGVKTPYAAQNFEAYSTGDFSDWADGLSSTGSRIGSSHVDYSGSAGSGCSSDWFIGDSGTWIEFWFKHDETAPGDQVVWGMASPNAGTPQYGDSGFHMKLSFDTFALPESTPHATALCVMKGTSNSSDVMLMTQQTNPCDNEWHHIAVYLQPESEANGGSVFDNDGKLFLYVDGKLEDTYDNGGSFDMRSLPLGFSADTITLMANTNGSKNCRGQMDNFRVFSGTSLPVPFDVPAFVPNEDDAETPIAYALPAQVDSTLNLTDFSQVPAEEGQSPVWRNGKYTPADQLNIIGFVNSFDSEFPIPQSSDDDLSNFLGFPQRPGMAIIDTVGGSMWIWAGDYDPIDDVGGWVTVDLFSGGGAPA